MNVISVRILREQCCGHGECNEIAPDVFVLDSRRKSVVIDEAGASLETLLAAAEACPCSAILVEDEDGGSLVP